MNSKGWPRVKIIGFKISSSSNLVFISISNKLTSLNSQHHISFFLFIFIDEQCYTSSIKYKIIFIIVQKKKRKKLNNWKIVLKYQKEYKKLFSLPMMKKNMCAQKEIFSNNVHQKKLFSINI